MGIWAAVERRDLHSGQAIAPEEGITVLQALQMYTRNPAYIGFEEKPERLAGTQQICGFIVVDRGVLSVPSEQLKDVQVLKTFVGGELVYQNARVR
ncbi:MAG TPA: amidohydrolase family protein [Candidatus Acidoferrum sp.]